MKIKALVNFQSRETGKLKLRLIGDVFDIEKKEAEHLIKIGYAKSCERR